MAASKAIKIGLVGLGRAGIKMHCEELKGFKSKFKIVAACDPLADRRTFMENEYGCRTYRKFEDLLKDDEVELVDIASPTTFHVDQALAALKAGKHVFLEKPIGISHSEAKKLSTAMKRAKGRLLIRHNRRFEPAFQHVREIIDSGILGQIHNIKLRRGSFQFRDDWQTIIDAGGGQLLNWGPHIIDHALRFLGGEVKELWSDLQSLACAGDAEDHLKIVMKNSKDLVVDLEISGIFAQAEPAYVVMGDRGSLTCSADEQTLSLKYIDPKQKLPKIKAKRKSPGFDQPFGGSTKVKWIEKTLKVRPKLRVTTHSIWKYLYETLRNGADFPITLEEALQVMEVIAKVKKGTPFNLDAKKKKAR